MEKYTLQADADAPWDENPDLPGVSSEKQTFVDEDALNEPFEPVNDAFSGLRDLGDWVIEFLSELFSGAFGNIL